MAKKKQDFVVEGLASSVDDNTVVLTSSEDIEKRSMDMLLAAMKKYEYTKEQYGVQFSGTSAERVAARHQLLPVERDDTEPVYPPVYLAG